MTNGKLISYKTVVENVMRNHPFTESHINDDLVLEWIGSFMQHTNSPVVYTDKIEYKEVESGRAKLPNDLHLLNTIGRISNCNNLTINQMECGEGKVLPMRWTSDTFHTRYHNDDRDYTRQDGTETYTVNSNYVFTSFSAGYVAISYKAIPTDSEGFPMIPGDEHWVKAVEYDIAYRIGYILWTQDKLKDKIFLLLERERDWYFAQAVNYSKIPSVDQMESLTNQNTKMVPRLDSHATFFANMQMPEKRKWR